MTTDVFRPTEFGMAFGLALGVELGLVVLLMTAGAGTALTPKEEPIPREIPIAVTPVIEDLPLLKLGSKVREQALPDMWRKPTPKKRYEDKSAPSPHADKNPETLPTNELAKSRETPAPTDAELAKRVDEDIIEEEDTKAPNMREDGHEDGVVGGTETDPLKAFVIDQYKAKLIAWFKAGFNAPIGEEYCDITTLITAAMGADRTVKGFNLAQPSGNATFDAKVRAHMETKVGRQVPPPPPKYPELAESVLRPKFSGENSSCKKNKSAVKSPPPAADPGEAPPRDEAPPISPGPSRGSGSDSELLE